MREDFRTSTHFGIKDHSFLKHPLYASSRMCRWLRVQEGKVYCVLSSPLPHPSCHEPLGGLATSLFPDFLDFSLDNTLWKNPCKFWKVTIEKILTLWVFSAFKKTNSYGIFGKTVSDGERDEAPPRPFCLPFSLLALIAKTIKNCCIKSTK